MASANPFRVIAEAAKRIVARPISALTVRQKPPYLKQRTRSGVAYMPEHVYNKHRVMAEWYTGSEDSPPTAADLHQLMQSAEWKSGYTMIITGITETDYPGKEGELVVTLSIRVNRKNIYNALNNWHNHNEIDIINQLSRPTLKVRWAAVYEVAILDKEDEE